MTSHNQSINADLAQMDTENAVIAQVVANAAAKEPVTIASGRRGDTGDLVEFVINPGQRIHELDLESYFPTPSRHAGSVRLTDHQSFIAYCKRHWDPETTTVWGNPHTGQLHAIFNDHSAEAAGWRDFQAYLSLELTEDWKHWTGSNGRMMTQAMFAEHLEDGADAVVNPSAADMLEIAQSFHAKNSVNFRSAKRLDSGEVQLTYEETVTARAGQKGSMEIPTSFELGLAPFEGGPTYRVLARFRYRLNEGHLSLGYKLVRPDVIQTGAFNDIAKAVAEELSTDVLLGLAR